MMDDDDEYEEDSAIIKKPSLSLQQQQLKQQLSKGGKPDSGVCQHCDRQLLRRPSLVEAQTQTGIAGSAAAVAPGSNAATKCDDMVLVPRDLLAAMQRYFLAVKEAYYNYSVTDGDSREVVRRLFEQTPEVLSAANRQGRSPIESALAQGKWAAGAELVKLAGSRNPQALRHRTAAGEDVTMLAVAGGSEATVLQLLEQQQQQRRGRDVCLHYDLLGRNSLHLCALGDSVRILEVLLAAQTELLASGQLSPDCATAALSTSDRDGCTPLHYMARRNQAGMLAAVHQFTQRARLRLDWDVTQAGGGGERGLTPLAVAAEADALEACEFLLNRGLAGIDLHDQLDMWLQVAIGDSARALLGRHCSLLATMAGLPAGNLQRLQDGLRERGLTEEFLLRLRSRWPDLPQLPTVVTVLTVCQNFSGSCRLIVWDILCDLTGDDLAQLLVA